MYTLAVTLEKQQSHSLCTTQLHLESPRRDNAFTPHKRQSTLEPQVFTSLCLVSYDLGCFPVLFLHINYSAGVISKYLSLRLE